MKASKLRSYMTALKKGDIVNHVLDERYAIYKAKEPERKAKEAQDRIDRLKYVSDHQISRFGIRKTNPSTQFEGIREFNVVPKQILSSNVEESSLTSSKLTHLKYTTPFK